VAIKDPKMEASGETVGKAFVISTFHMDSAIVEERL